MSARGLADAQSGRTARVQGALEVALWVALVAVGASVATQMIRSERIAGVGEGGDLGDVVIPGLVEVEDLERHTSRNFGFWLQPAELPGGWSRGAHMFASGTVEGDWVDLELPRVEPGRYALEVFLTRAEDYGIVALALDGRHLADVDLWTPNGVYATGPIALGEIDVDARAHVLRVTVVGANPRSADPHFQFAIDGVRLTPLAPGKEATR